jgi:hypothetical protein
MIVTVGSFIGYMLLLQKKALCLPKKLSPNKEERAYAC